MEIATSLLNVKEEESVHTFYRLETAHTDYFHIDVMDGKFVKNDTVEKMKIYSDNLKNITNIPLDVHLMTLNVKEYVDIFSPNEPNCITFHIEATKDKEEVINLINYIKQYSKVGIAISPNTPVENIYEYLPLIHSVMVMTVEPGEGGQSLIPETIEKIKKIREYIDSNNLDTEIEVDGGVNLDNIKMLKDAGADIAVAGTCIINSKDYRYTINKLKD